MRLFNELPEDGQIRTATKLGETRAEQGDLTNLADWAQNFPPGAARANAVAGAIGAAFQKDASRIEPLLASLATAADRDAALRGLAERMSDIAPADAATRALTIGDPALRRETLATVVTSWLKRDRDATEAWLQNASDIPSEWKLTWLPAR